MQNDRKSGIYCIENLVTNKKYIGQSINIDDRWYKHKHELNHNTHDNDYLQNAWNKYGEKEFVFYILEYCDIDKLDEKENYYIEYYKTLDRDYGYNLKTGGQNGGSIVSDYVRNKLSNSLKETYANNEELKSLRKNKALIQWANPQIKEKILGENNGMYGKHHTEETRRKISEKHKGKVSPKRDIRPVICVELNKVFADAVTASKELSGWSGGILSVCSGERKTCGGYHWKFLLENNIS